MSMRQRVALIVEEMTPWAIVLIVPLVINLLVWYGLVRPQQRALENWQETHSAAAMKPKLETLLAQSQQLLSQWTQTSFSQADPAAVMQTIQRLAGVYHLQVKELTTTSAQPVGGSATMPLELEVLGSYHKLARWMGDVESQAGLQIDSWTITPGHEPGEPHHLSVHMTALLQRAS